MTFDTRRLAVNARVELLTVNQISKESSQSTGQHAKYHSELAMQAARKMRNSKQKQKTGQMVCHHLRMMLTSELLFEDTAFRDTAFMDSASSDGAAVNDQQYRLGF
jgi:hypothetical protein